MCIWMTFSIWTCNPIVNINFVTQIVWSSLTFWYYFLLVGNGHSLFWFSANDRRHILTHFDCPLRPLISQSHTTSVALTHPRQTADAIELILYGIKITLNKLLTVIKAYFMNHFKRPLRYYSTTHSFVRSCVHTLQQWTSGQTTTDRWRHDNNKSMWLA